MTPIGSIRLRGAGVGLLAAAVSLAVGEVVAGVLSTMGTVVSVGAATIDLTPPWLKDFAIRAFGTADKAVLIGGIFVVLSLIAVALGIVGMRRPRLAYVGLALLGALGVAASSTRPGATWIDAVPPIAGAAAGALAFRILRRAAVTRPTPQETDADEPARPPKVVATDRRGFLKAAMLVGGAAVLAGAAGRGLSSRSQAGASRSALRLPRAEASAAPVPPGADLHVPGVEPFMTSNESFYRIDTSLVVPRLTAEDWSLKINGMVDSPVELSYEDLLDRPMIERDITLACVSNEVGGNYIGNARWVGVPLKPLMDEIGVDPASDQMVSRSIDGFTIGTPVNLALDGRDSMLAVQMNGEPLPFEHGFPVRMVVPGLYGYISAMKWITNIEMSTYDAFDAYWIRRGWAPIAPILTQSRIDTPRPYGKQQAGPITVAGFAWAQHRGIPKVEVRVDEGEWNEAILGAEDTADTWRQWKWEWDAPSGRHTLQVRAADGDGQVQTEERTPPAPDGARGWHTITVEVA